MRNITADDKGVEFYAPLVARVPAGRKLNGSAARKYSRDEVVVILAK